MISSLFAKGLFSAIVGSPIAYSLNLGVLPTFSELIDENIWLASFLILLPFIIASTIRMTVIDYVYEKYKVNLDPMYYIKKRLAKLQV